MIIAIDGPAGSGKSTTARLVADRLGFAYLDSGAMYRAVALKALAAEVDLESEEALTELVANSEIELSNGQDGKTVVVLDGEDVSSAIRQPEVSDASSKVAAIVGVRSELVTKQRAILEDGDYVSEGRDIGTVVAPQAEVKVFLTATPEERARRRAAELTEAGKSVEVETVAEAIRSRDDADTTRASSPLVAASDAVELDTTGLSIDDVVDCICELVERSR